MLSSRRSLPGSELVRIVALVWSLDMSHGLVVVDVLCFGRSHLASGHVLDLGSRDLVFHLGVIL